MEEGEGLGECAIVTCRRKEPSSTPSLAPLQSEQSLIHSPVSLAPTQESVCLDERFWLVPYLIPTIQLTSLVPCRLWSGLPPWCPYRSALHWGSKEAPAGGRAREQFPAQGEGEEGLRLLGVNRLALGIAPMAWLPPGGTQLQPGLLAQSSHLCFFAQKIPFSLGTSFHLPMGSSSSSGTQPSEACWVPPTMFASPSSLPLPLQHSCGAMRSSSWGQAFQVSHLTLTTLFPPMVFTVSLQSQLAVVPDSGPYSASTSPFSHPRTGIVDVLPSPRGSH